MKFTRKNNPIKKDMDETGNHHSQKTDARTGNQTQHVLTHKWVLNIHIQLPPPKNKNTIWEKTYTLITVLHRSLSICGEEQEKRFESQIQGVHSGLTLLYNAYIIHLTSSPFAGIVSLHIITGKRMCRSLPCKHINCGHRQNSLPTYQSQKS
ncbi:hypothetical protein AAY473_019796, partial [Plecturocebus cupreus]